LEESRGISVGESTWFFWAHPRLRRGPGYPLQFPGPPGRGIPLLSLARARNGTPFRALRVSTPQPNIRNLSAGAGLSRGKTPPTAKTGGVLAPPPCRGLQFRSRRPAFSAGQRAKPPIFTGNSCTPPRQRMKKAPSPPRRRHTGALAGLADPDSDIQPAVTPQAGGVRAPFPDRHPHPAQQRPEARLKNPRPPPNPKSPGIRGFRYETVPAGHVQDCF
jgi:hypothetical protein